MTFAFKPLMPGGNKKVPHTLSVQLQVCLSMCDLFVPRSIKGLKKLYIELFKCECHCYGQ